MAQRGLRRRSFAGNSMTGLDLLADWKSIPKHDLLRITQLDLTKERPSFIPEEIAELTLLEELHISLSPTDEAHTNTNTSTSHATAASTHDRSKTANAPHRIPLSISRLSSLTYLSIEKSDLTEFPDAILACSQLKVLRIVESGLSFLPLSIGKLSNLTHLDVSKNHILFLPQEIGLLDQLKMLILSYNHLTFNASTVPTENGFASSKSLTAKSPGSKPSFLSKDGSRIFAIPPQLCLLQNCQIVLTGNKGIKYATITTVENLFKKDHDPITRSLSLYKILTNTPQTPLEYADQFQDFASQLTGERFNLSKENKDGLERVIRCAMGCNATKYLNSDIVQTHVKGLWYNKSRFHEIVEEQQRSPKSWSMDGFAFKLSVFFQLMVPRFLFSIKAKYILSLVMYLFYLVLVTSYVAHKTSTENISTYEIRNLIFNQNSGFDSVGSIDQIWPYIEESFLPSFFNNTVDIAFYTPNSTHAPSVESFYRPLYPIRLRQLRVKPRPCRELNYNAHENRKHDDKAYCSPSYTNENEDKRSYGPNKEFSYRTFNSLALFPSYSPSGIWYPAHGYVEEIPLDPTSAFETTERLKNSLWIDTSTRYLVIQYMSSVDNLDALSVTTIKIECFPTGICYTRGDAQIIPKVWITKNDHTTNFFIISLFIWMAAFILYQLQRLWIISNLKTIDSWAVFDMVLFMLYFIVFILEMESNRLNHNGIFGSSHVIDSFQNILEIASIWGLESRIMGFVLFMSFVRIFSYSGIHPYIGPMQSIFRRMISDILEFMSLLGVFLLALSSYFYSSYGAHIESYRYLQTSLQILMSQMFGNYDFSENYSMSPIFGQIDSFVYLVSAPIILVNFMISVLASPYDQIRGESIRNYRKLFCETVMFLQDAPYPPPLNLFQPFIEHVFRLFKYRVYYWKPLLSYRRYVSNISWALSPTKLHIFSFKSTKHGAHFSSIWFDVIVLWIWKIAVIPLVLLTGPIAFNMSFHAPTYYQGLAKFLHIFSYGMLLLIWTGSFPLWYVLATLSNAIVALFSYCYFSLFMKKEDNAVVEMTELLPFSQADTKGQLVDLTKHKAFVTSNLSQGKDTIFICSNSGPPSTNHVFDYTLFDFHEVVQLDFTVFQGGFVFGVVPKGYSEHPVVGLGRCSFGINSITGDIIKDGRIITKLDIKPSKKYAFKLLINFLEDTVTIIANEAKTTVQVAFLPGQELCPALGVLRGLSSGYLYIHGSRLHNQVYESSFDSCFLETREADVALFSNNRIAFSGYLGDLVHTLFSATPFLCNSGVVYFGEIDVVNIGQDQQITLGISTKEGPVHSQIGTYFGSFAVHIDLQMGHLVVLDCIHSEQPRVSTFSLAKYTASLPIGVSFLVDCPRESFFVFINHQLVKTAIGSIPPYAKAFNIGVSFGSHGQIAALTNASAPKHIMHQVERYIEYSGNEDAITSSQDSPSSGAKPATADGSDQANRAYETIFQSIFRF